MPLPAFPNAPLVPLMLTVVPLLIFASLPANWLSALSSCPRVTAEKSPIVSMHNADNRSARRNASSYVPTGATCSAWIMPAAHAEPPPRSSRGVCHTGRSYVLYVLSSVVSSDHRRCKPLSSRTFLQMATFLQPQST